MLQVCLLDRHFPSPVIGILLNPWVMNIVNQVSRMRKKHVIRGSDCVIGLSFNLNCRMTIPRRKNDMQQTVKDNSQHRLALGIPWNCYLSQCLVHEEDYITPQWSSIHGKRSGDVQCASPRVLSEWDSWYLVMHSSGIMSVGFSNYPNCSLMLQTKWT
jgi:hypothetical protein